MRRAPRERPSSSLAARRAGLRLGNSLVEVERTSSGPRLCERRLAELPPERVDRNVERLALDLLHRGADPLERRVRRGEEAYRTGRAPCRERDVAETGQGIADL